MTNDASDACRHFIWARKMALELDIQFSEELLTAHESNPAEAPEERAMDLANNRLALARSITDRGKNLKRTDEEILAEFKKSWKTGELTILKEKPDNVRGEK